jgi:hypothetical protein
MRRKILGGIDHASVDQQSAARLATSVAEHDTGNTARAGGRVSQDAGGEMIHTCFKSDGAGFGIELIQTGFNEFTVKYGLQIKRHLRYSEAAAELGSCIMHAAACNGDLDSRTKAEAKRDGDTKPYIANEVR